MTDTCLLALDQGTTSTRTILFDAALRPIAVDQREFRQIYPRPGWVEHDPEEIWQSSLATIRNVLAKAGRKAADVAGLGIANQRETTVVWDRSTGKPIYNAIVWQDRRTSDECARMRAEGLEPEIAGRTGLLLDPYFSATKLGWILANVPGAMEQAQRGELAFGNVDSFLLWRLSGGKVHATDATNASRTLLYDLRSGSFDADLCSVFEVPPSVLPDVQDSAADFGTTAPGLFDGGMALAGVAGDQQAAVVGQACFSPGMMKVTYGTGAFALLNTGGAPVFSKNRLLTTVAYQLGGRRNYALEGSIFVAGAAVQWLRDQLGLVANAGESAALAAAADPADPVILVPAFTGLGAPYWDADARGALLGLTRKTGRAEIVRAALESVAFQTRDLLEAMERDWPSGAQEQRVLRVDGGMVANDWLLQALADITGCPVDRPSTLETTALGAAYLAGLQTGICPPPNELTRDGALTRFEPVPDRSFADARYGDWQRAVGRVLTAAPA